MNDLRLFLCLILNFVRNVRQTFNYRIGPIPQFVKLRGFLTTGLHSHTSSLGRSVFQTYVDRISLFAFYVRGAVFLLRARTRQLVFYEPRWGNRTS